MSHPVPSQYKAIHAVIVLATLATLGRRARRRAGEGRVATSLPGANATLVDLPPAGPGGSSSRCTSTTGATRRRACRRLPASLPTRT